MRYRFTLSLGRDPATGNRRQRVYTFDDLKARRAGAGRLTGRLADGRYHRPDQDATVGDALDAYLASATVRAAEATKVSYAGALLPVRDRLGRRKLQSLTRADVESLRDWIRRRAPPGRRAGHRPLGPRSVALTLGRLKAALARQAPTGV